MRRHLWPLALAALAVLAVRPEAQSRPVPAVYISDPTTVECASGDQPCQDWLTFRDSVLGPYQAFAIAAHDARATVILSEPFAPRAELLELVDTVFGSSLVRRSYRRWSTGLDGWLEDLVLEVNVDDRRTTRVVSGHDLAGWNAPAAVIDRLLFLYAGLYGTTDGFTVDNVNAMKDVDLGAIPELRVPAADLLDWLEDTKKTWDRLPPQADAKAAGFQALRTTKTPSVYAREDQALVVLVVPAKSALTDLAEPFRRFAVASDVLLGAYRLTNGPTLLVGRTRQVPFTTLPPLRFETFASFVRYRTTELAQSYERQRVFAGKIQHGQFAGWDWAPILLSSQLDDSEFGTLLNEADQILKSWSEAGSVDYYAFDHPDPDDYPFDEEAASEYFERQLGTTSLVFNWNTTGFTTIHQLDRGELLTPDRYGALPILYLPTGNIADALGDVAPQLAQSIRDRQTKSAESVSKKAATHARDFFATLGDPVLVRVAQNALLYQAAEAFLNGLTTSETPKPARWTTVSQILRDLATERLRESLTNGSAPRASAADARVARAIKESGLTVTELAEIIATPQATATRLTQASARSQHAAESVLALYGRLDKARDEYDKAFDSFCNEVGGKKTHRTDVDPATKKPSEREFCEYSESRHMSAAFQLTRVNAAEREFQSLRAQFETALETYEESTKEARDLAKSYERADAIAKRLTDNPRFARDLDAVLERVRARTTGGPIDGSIKTPAVVLSRNRDDEDMVGGHNISFDPVRVKVAASMPPIGPASRAAIPSRATIRLAGAEPAPDAAAALKTSRSGTLLQEIRATSSGTIDAGMAADLTRQASTCACDALVVRSADGDLYFVRNAPPPIQRRLPGATAIIDALAGPPKASVVRFDGFDASPAVVEDIARSVQLAGAAPAARPGALRRLTESAKSIFDPRGSETSTWFSFARRGERAETLRIVGDAAAGPALRTPVAWRTATVGPSTAPRQTTLQNATSITVRFPPRTGPITIEAVDVVVAMGAGRPAATTQRLSTVVQTALARTPAGTTTVVDGVLSLRKSIGEQMKPVEINFFFEHNSKTLRVSEFIPAAVAPLRGH
jgi:hypothetical protein